MQPRRHKNRNTHRGLPRAAAPSIIAEADARSSAAELRERVKELACLYEVAAAFVEHRASLPDCFRRIAAILPAAWRYPDLAEACVELDGIAEATPGFGDAPRLLSSEIRVGSRPRGRVSVGYRPGAPADAPDPGAEPFLPEERSLLDTVARQIGVFVESVEAEARRARMEAQLRHADRLATIGQLAAGVAHELNEPLGNILGFAQLALKAEGVPAQVRADLDRIVKASLHGREVIRKLLVFARQAPVAPQRVNLNAVIEEAIFLLEAGCERPGIRFVRDLDPDLPDLLADPVQLRQVLMNLAVNAVHAIDDRGTITVRTARDGAYVILSVEDTGRGMTPEVAQHAFDPFFTTKDVGQGTGLGLAVVQGIVIGHGGEIDLQTAPGAGARFRVRLPIDPQRTPPLPPPVEHPAAP